MSKEDLKISKSIDAKWKKFEKERSSPKFATKEGPNWLTMLEREGYLKELLRIVKTFTTY